MKSPLILALDIGTSSVRAALYDGAGNVLPETFVKNERLLEVTDDGGAEIDALAACKQIERAIDDVLEKSSKINEEIEYVAVSAFWHSLVGIDEKGNPTTKVFGWADTRSSSFVQFLRSGLDEGEIHNRTGARFHSSYWTAKLVWLKQKFPEIFAKTAKWLSFSDLLARRFFGEAVTSLSMASGTGIFDVRKCLWDQEICRFLQISPEKLPRIARETETFSLSPKWARRWLKLENAKWFPAIGDGAANNVGAGCVEKSKAALMIGTSGAMRVAYEGRVPARIPVGLWCYRIDREKIIIGGALSDGGGLFRWLKDNLSLSGTDDDIENEISRRLPDAHGLTFLPFLAGERSVGYHENARGAILGLKMATDAIDIVQAALEAVAFRFAEIYDQLNEICKIKQVVASGGALRESPVWTQIIADVLAQKIFLPDTREASSRGAVLFALEKIGKLDDLSNLLKPPGRTFAFDEKRNVIYQKARQRHRKYYDLLFQQSFP